MPFGEILAEQHSIWDSPYKFNGKEMDTETGLYYYGVRYYDPKLCIWLGVDPMREKDPDISPYAYCQNNPVKYTDPDGKIIVLAGSTQQKQTILKHLQKLTDYKLSYIPSTGRVFVKLAVTGNKPKGTTLINNLMKSREKTTIQLGAPGSKNWASAENFANSHNNIGTGGTVNFDPTADPGIYTKDPVTGFVSKKKRPHQIGLGHELIHADHYNRGNVDRTKRRFSYQKERGRFFSKLVKKEELRTVGLKYVMPGDITENDLRKEQISTKNNMRCAY
jgi:RHS repeat-associated protein